MKRAVLLIVILFVSMAASAMAAGTTAIFIHGAGCPHCAELDKFLTEMEDKYPELEV